MAKAAAANAAEKPVTAITAAARTRSQKGRTSETIVTSKSVVSAAAAAVLLAAADTHPDAASAAQPSSAATDPGGAAVVHSAAAVAGTHQDIAYVAQPDNACATTQLAAAASHLGSSALQPPAAGKGDRFAEGGRGRHLRRTTAPGKRRRHEEEQAHDCTKKKEKIMRHRAEKTDVTYQGVRREDEIDDSYSKNGSNCSCNASLLCSETGRLLFSSLFTAESLSLSSVWGVCEDIRLNKRELVNKNGMHVTCNADNVGNNSNTGITSISSSSSHSTTTDETDCQSVAAFNSPVKSKCHSLSCTSSSTRRSSDRSSKAYKRPCHDEKSTRFEGRLICNKVPDSTRKSDCTSENCPSSLLPHLAAQDEKTIFLKEEPSPVAAAAIADASEHQTDRDVPTNATSSCEQDMKTNTAKLTDKCGERIERILPESSHTASVTAAITEEERQHATLLAERWMARSSITRSPRQPQQQRTSPQQHQIAGGKNVLVFAAEEDARLAAFLLATQVVLERDLILSGISEAGKGGRGCQRGRQAARNNSARAAAHSTLALLLLDEEIPLRANDIISFTYEAHLTATISSNTNECLAPLNAKQFKTTEQGPSSNITLQYNSSTPSEKRQECNESIAGSSKVPEQQPQFLQDNKAKMKDSRCVKTIASACLPRAPTLFVYGTYDIGASLGDSACEKRRSVSQSYSLACGPSVKVTPIGKISGETVFRNTAKNQLLESRRAFCETEGPWCIYDRDLSSCRLPGEVLARRCEAAAHPEIPCEPVVSSLDLVRAERMQQRFRHLQHVERIAQGPIKLLQTLPPLPSIPRPPPSFSSMRVTFTISGGVRQAADSSCPGDLEEKGGRRTAEHRSFRVTADLRDLHAKRPITNQITDRLFNRDDAASATAADIASPI